MSKLDGYHGSFSCGGCGGPHRYDTSVPSAVWNEVIRARGLDEGLCTNCILEEFARLGRSFTAELYGSEVGLSGVAVEFRINAREAQDAALIQTENNALRVKLSRAVELLAGLRCPFCLVSYGAPECFAECAYNCKGGAVRAFLAIVERAK